MDNDLIDGIRKGDTNSFRILYQKLYGPLVVYAHNLTNDRATAEGLVQNVFLKLWNNREKILITTSIKSYLYRSVFNEFHTEYEREKRKKSVLEQY